MYVNKKNRILRSDYAISECSANFSLAVFVAQLFSFKKLLCDVSRFCINKISVLYRSMPTDTSVTISSCIMANNTLFDLKRVQKNCKNCQYVEYRLLVSLERTISKTTKVGTLLSDESYRAMITSARLGMRNNGPIFLMGSPIF